MGLKFKVIPGVITREMNGNISVRPRKTPPPINKARYNMPVFHGILSSLPLLTSAGRRRIRFTSLARSKMHIWTINGILLRVNDKFGRRSIIRYTCRTNLYKYNGRCIYLFWQLWTLRLQILSERLSRVMACVIWYQNKGRNLQLSWFFFIVAWLDRRNDPVNERSVNFSKKKRKIIKLLYFWDEVSIYWLICFQNIIILLCYINIFFIF